MVRFELTTFSMSKRRANQLRYTTWLPLEDSNLLNKNQNLAY